MSALKNKNPVVLIALRVTLSFFNLVSYFPRVLLTNNVQCSTREVIFSDFKECRNSFFAVTDNYNVKTLVEHTRGVRMT